ncbi:MAG: hypothetical protein JXB38_20435 [Anaerolineales bacterium]|nr:hypothetical protein [Anaerolineales bacterium]
MAIPQNSNSRSKLRYVLEFCPCGHGIASIFLLPKIFDFSSQALGELVGILEEEIN